MQSVDADGQRGRNGQHRTCREHGDRPEGDVLRQGHGPGHDQQVGRGNRQAVQTDGLAMTMWRGKDGRQGRPETVNTPNPTPRTALTTSIGTRSVLSRYIGDGAPNAMSPTANVRPVPQPALHHRNEELDHHGDAEHHRRHQARGGRGRAAPAPPTTEATPGSRRSR